MADPTSQIVDRLLRAHAAERRRERAWLRACRFVALGFAVWYVGKLIIEKVMDPFYLLINLWAIFTGLSALVVIKVYELPRLLDGLLASDPATAKASCDAVHGLGPELVEILRVLDHPRPVEAAQAVDCQQLARLLQAKQRWPWRRIARWYLGIYLLAMAGFLAVILAYQPRF